MAIQIIKSLGSREVTVSASQSIAISTFGGDLATVFYLTAYGNQPQAWRKQTTLVNEEIVLGPMSSDQDVRIEAGSNDVSYQIGSSPSSLKPSSDLSADSEITGEWTFLNDVIIDGYSLRINKDDVGGTAANTKADELIIEKTGGEGGITIKTDNNSVGNIYFADPDSNMIGRILYNHNNNSMLIHVNENQCLTIASDGDVSINQGNLESTNDVYVGKNGGGNSTIYFYDDNSNTWRSFFWSDTGEKFFMENNSGVNHQVWTSSDNSSVGSGVSGSFTTTDGKTVTVTNGIVTNIV